MSTQVISITVEKTTIRDLDKIRGLAKRSTIINDILTKFVNKKNTENPRQNSQHKQTQSIKKGDVI
jgi:metal-responsive CopG/Arc/MetJ family transcriptional regulator